MGKRRLLWHLFPSHLLVALLAMVAVWWYASKQLHDFHLERTTSDLTARSTLVRRQLAAVGGIGDPAKVDKLCKDLGAELSTRVTVIGSAGTVIGDSHETPKNMSNHRGPDRPEIMDAMAGRTGVAPTRYSETLKQNMLYVAVPMRREGKVVAVVRTALPITGVESALHRIHVNMGISMAVVALLTAAVSLILSRRISRPLEELRRGAKKFARGDLEHRLPTTDLAETRSLAKSLNRMAAQLQKQMNRMRRLEVIRRDFVANVSHELRTPITPIRAAVESLRDGGLEDEEQVRHFLSMIARHAERLQAIVEDLLRLSRIEEQEQTEVELVPSELGPILSVAVASCETAAAAKQLDVTVTCPDPLAVRADPPLLETAVVNLVDNAVKYSRPGGRIWVEGKAGDSEVVISVRDEGCGIEPKHQSRLFERFYRVDKARSRKLGGTGLGLAIVKHIAQLHGGSVTVSSSPGKGSVFTIQLPPV